MSIDGNGPFVRKKIPSPLAQRNVWAALSACQSNRLPARGGNVRAARPVRHRLRLRAGQPPLRKIMEENGRLAPNVAVQLIDQICEAVQELQPAALFTATSTPATSSWPRMARHIIDFGIAHPVRGNNRSRDTTALGTYGFASPEQYGFAKTDARSDVFSLGRLLRIHADRRISRCQRLRAATA